MRASSKIAILMVVAFLVAALASFLVYAIVARHLYSHSGVQQPMGLTAIGFWPFLVLPIQLILFVAVWLMRSQRNKPPNALFSQLAVITFAVVTAIFTYYVYAYFIVARLPHSRSGAQIGLGVTAAGLWRGLIALIVLILLVLILRKYRKYVDPYEKPSPPIFMLLIAYVLLNGSVFVWQTFRDHSPIISCCLALATVGGVCFLIGQMRDCLRVRRILNYSHAPQLETALKGCEERSTAQQGSTAQKS